MDDRAPFDAGDPMDAVAEMFRLQITQLALDAQKITIYRDLAPQQQLQSFIAGAMTGLVGVALASVQTAGADAMVDYLVECIPYARQQAEGVRDEDGNTLKNHHDDVGNAREPS
jgi:hypothetical protein